MSSSSGTVGGSESRTVTVEQLVGECFVKTAQTILSSRVYEAPQSGSKERNAKRSAWFKLDLTEVESARDSLDRWRLERGVGLPLVLEIYLHPSISVHQGEDTPGTLVERWLIHYSPSTAGILPLPLAAGGLSRSQLARFNPQAVYKRLTLLVRSVYSYCRVLPAYRLYRTARASHRSPPFYMKYHLHSTLPSHGDILSRQMQRYDFSPVETADGQFNLAVEYQPASTVRVLGQAAVRNIPRAAIIQDYVRSTGEVVSSTQGHPRSITTTRGSPSPPQISPTAATTAAAAAGLESAPSAPAALSTTPRRRSWSSSFRLSPARSFEPQLLSSPGSSPSPRYLNAHFGGQSPPPHNTTIHRGSAGADEEESSSSTTHVSVESYSHSLSTPSRPMSRARPPLPPSAPSSQGGMPSRQRVGSFGSSSSSSHAVVGAASASPPAVHGSTGAVVVQAGQKSATGYASDNEDEEEEEVREVEDGEGSSSVGSHRRISPPMKIPGFSAAHYHRSKSGRPLGLRSSGDLRTLDKGHNGAPNGGGGAGGEAIAGQNKATQKPLSAPAVSHMRPASSSLAAAHAVALLPVEKPQHGSNDAKTNPAAAAVGSQTAAAPGPGPLDRSSASCAPSSPHDELQHSLSDDNASPAACSTAPLHPPTPIGDAGVPAAPPLYHPPSSFTESFGSSVAQFPASCSPDLPFAFTPTAKYSFSPASVGCGGSVLHRPSPTLSTGSGGGGATGLTPRGGVVLSGPPSPQTATSVVVLQQHSGGSSTGTLTTSAAAVALPPSPPVTGREIPSGVALMRRASWGTRSFYSDRGQTPAQAGDGPSPSLGNGGAGSAAGVVGYSISPLQDVLLESMQSVSTPRNLLRGSSGVMSRLIHVSSSAAVELHRDPLLITFPGSSATAAAASGAPTRQQSGSSSTQASPRFGSSGTGHAMPAMPREDSERLPFDFEGSGHSDDLHHLVWDSGKGDAAVQGLDSPQNSARAAAAGDTEVQHPTLAHSPAQHTPHDVLDVVSPRPAALNMVSSAAAVGAFMRLVKEAQPLTGLAPVPLQAGVSQLEALRAKLQTHDLVE